MLNVILSSISWVFTPFPIQKSNVPYFYHDLVSFLPNQQFDDTNTLMIHVIHKHTAHCQLTKTEVGQISTLPIWHFQMHNGPPNPKLQLIRLQLSTGRTTHIKKLHLTHIYAQSDDFGSLNQPLCTKKKTSLKPLFMSGDISQTAAAGR